MAKKTLWFLCHNLSLLTKHAMSDISTDITLYTRPLIVHMQSTDSAICVKMTSKWEIMMQLDPLLLQCFVGRYHNRPSTIPTRTANQTISQNEWIAIFTCCTMPTCPLRACRSTLHLPQLAQCIVCNLRLSINHLRSDCHLFISSMLDSTASGYQIRVAAKCVSDSIAFTWHVNNFKIKLATEVQCRNLMLQQYYD